MPPLTDDQLAPGETIIWTSAPNRDRLLMRIDYLLVPLGFVIGVVAAAALVAAVLAIFDGDGAAAFLGLLLALLTGALALWLVFGRFISRFRQARDSVYAMTETRLFERRAVSGSDPIIKSVQLSDDPPISMRRHYEQRGTIRVGPVELFNIDNAAVAVEEIHAQIAQVKRR
jgi:hypothetical protein